jgi:hypothetical protein
MSKRCVVMMGSCISTVDTLRAKLSVDDYHCISIDECTSKSKKKMFDEAFVLARDEIQPVGGLKSYRNAKLLLENIKPSVLARLSEFSSISIIGLSVCLVGNCIDDLIEWLPKTTKVDIYLITPFSFEGMKRLAMSDEIIIKIKNNQDKFSSFSLHIYDGRECYGFNERSVSLVDLLNLVSNDIPERISIRYTEHQLNH